MQSLVRFTLAFIVSLTLGACATRAPTAAMLVGIKIVDIDSVTHHPDLVGSTKFFNHIDKGRSGILQGLHRAEQLFEEVVGEEEDRT